LVRAGSVAHSAEVILGTEWNQSASVVQATGEVSGAMVCKSHRPVNGFSTSAASVENFNELTDVGPGGPNTILRVPLSQMTPDPKPGFSPKSRLDWVGRNHGTYKLDGAGWDLR